MKVKTTIQNTVAAVVFYLAVAGLAIEAYSYLFGTF